MPTLHQLLESSELDKQLTKDLLGKIFGTHSKNHKHRNCASKSRLLKRIKKKSTKTGSKSKKSKKSKKSNKSMRSKKVKKHRKNK